MAGKAARKPAGVARVELAGGCSCGAVRYLGRGEPLWIAHCHCRDCQKNTGAALATYVGFARGQFAFAAVAPKVYRSSPGVERKFCGRCGTPVTYESTRWPTEVHVLACTLDEPGRVAPQAHVYVKEQQPWLRLSDGLPRYRTTSRDSPPEA